MSLENKNIIVSGATSGIGASLAAALSAQKANVFIGGRRANLGEEVAKDTNSTFHVLDVADEESNKAFFAAAENHFGGKNVDFVLLNAGTEGTNDTTQVETLDIKTYDTVFGANVRGVLLGLQYGTPLLRMSGTVVVTSSVVSMVPVASNPIYAASKAAVNSLVKSYAAQFKDSKDERVQSLSIMGMNPTAYKSDMVDRFMGTDDIGVQTTIAKMFNPSQRLGHPDELAETMVKFARGELPYQNGDLFAVDADTHFPAMEFMERLQKAIAAASS